MIMKSNSVDLEYLIKVKISLILYIVYQSYMNPLGLL